MIAKNQAFDKYQISISIVFSILYYGNTALSLFVAESSKNYTGFFTTFFILYSLDKFMTFIISKAWQHKQGFFAWILDCFNLGFFAVIYYSRKDKNIFKSIYRLKLMVSIIPMTILQIIYFFNQKLLQRHILSDDSIAISQIQIAIFILNMIFIAFAFTHSLQKPNIYKADYLNNLLQISFKKHFAILNYNIIHFISYYGMWAILCSQQFYYYDKLSLAIIAAIPALIFSIIEMILTKSPIPLLNIFFNHPQIGQKDLKNNVQGLKQNRIRPIRCYLQLLSMLLISIFLSTKSPFEKNSYTLSNIDEELEGFFNLIQQEIFRFNMFVYALTFICLLVNLKGIYQSFTCYWIDEEYNGNLSNIITKLMKNTSLKYVHINIFTRGSRSSSLNQPLIFDDEVNQTRCSDSDSEIFDNEDHYRLKASFLNRMVELQQNGGILTINKTIVIKQDVFMVDKEIFHQHFMTSFLSSAKQLPLSLSYRIEKKNIFEIIKSRHNNFGIEQQQNVINLIINNEKYKNDKYLQFTQNYFDSNLLSSIAYDKLLSPHLINLPALILYDLHEI